MSAIKINKLELDSLKRGDKPILLDFYADWCGPCRMLSPLVEEIAEETSEFKVCKVDVDDHLGIPEMVIHIDTIGVLLAEEGEED